MICDIHYRVLNQPRLCLRPQGYRWIDERSPIDFPISLGSGSIWSRLNQQQVSKGFYLAMRPSKKIQHPFKTRKWLSLRKNKENMRGVIMVFLPCFFFYWYIDTFSEAHLHGHPSTRFSSPPLTVRCANPETPTRHTLTLEPKPEVLRCWDQTDTCCLLQRPNHQLSLNLITIVSYSKN